MFSKTLTYVIVLTFTATFFLTLTGISDAKIDPQTVAGVWLFDEGSGDTAKDSSANGNNGKLKNIKWVDGKFGKALSFDGSTGYVLVPDSKSLSMTGNMTIVAWVNASKLAATAALIRKGSEGAADITWLWYLRSGTQLDMFSAAGEVATTFNPTTGTWYHLATTIDGSNKAKHYVNGVLKNNDFTSGSGTPTWKDDDKPLNIGEWSTFDFAGVMDEVAIFNVALAENDIKDIMTNGLQVSTVTAVSPSDKLTTTWAHLRVR